MAKHLNDEVGERVKQLRTAAGVSQEALAEAAGLHRTYVGNIERREANITLAALEQLAAALRVHPCDLLGCTGGPA